MLKRIMALLCAAALCAMCACSQNNETVSQEEESSSESGGSESPEETSRISVRSSSPTTPLGKDEWGSAAKYSPADASYCNVPVRITGIKRGKVAAKKAGEYFERHSNINAEKPGKGMEWVVAEYELSLDGFPVDEGGADASLSAVLQSADGGMPAYDGKYYSPRTICLSYDEYFFDGIVSGEIAYIVPQKTEDYILVLGEYGETQAYFAEKQ